MTVIALKREGTKKGERKKNGKIKTGNRPGESKMDAIHY